MFRFVLAFVLCTTLVLAAMSALACSCTIFWTPIELRDESDLVVAGRVLEIHPHPNGWDLIVSFETHAVWKGQVLPGYSLVTASDEAMCGYTFSVGEEYLVYGNEDSESRYFTHLCGRNSPLAFAGEDLDALGPPMVVPTDQPTFGMVKLRYQSE